MRESTLKADEFCMVGRCSVCPLSERMCLLFFKGTASVVYMDRKLKESFYRYDLIIQMLLFTEPGDNKYR